jgi:tetratricopeptide (TPR) repeat protein
MGLLHSLGTLLMGDGRYEEALPHLSSSHRMHVSALGKAHRSSLAVLADLAALRQQRGELGEAEALFREAADAACLAYGDTDPASLACMNNLALLLDRMDRCEDAEQLYTAVLSTRRATVRAARGLGDVDANDDVDVDGDALSTMNNLAAVLQRRGKAVEAEKLFVRVLAAQRRLLGDAHAEVLRTANNLAILYEDLQRFEDAVSYTR